MTALRTRRLGRSGLMVTELGLGAMDTPTSSEADATIEAAIAAGINFIDCAREYAGSEFLLGQAVRAREAKPFHVGTKTFSHNIDGSQRDVDRSLSMLGVASVDLYQLHDVTTPEAWAEVMDEDNGALAGLQTAQYRGLVDHIGVSSHSLEILELCIRSGKFDAVMLEYSAFFPQTAPLIALAADLDVGVIVMRPLGGSGRTSVMRGRLADGTAGDLTPANLLRYVLSNPGVSTAIPGARHPSRIEDNAAVATSYEPMEPDERAHLEALAAELY